MAPPTPQSANEQPGSNLWFFPLLTPHPLHLHPYLLLSHPGHPSLSFGPLAIVFSILIFCCSFGLSSHPAARTVLLKMKNHITAFTLPLRQYALRVVSEILAWLGHGLSLQDRSHTLLSLAFHHTPGPQQILTPWQAHPSL